MDMIQNRKEDIVKAKKFSRPILYWQINFTSFWCINQFYISTDFTFLPTLGYYWF
jgi:hypothetical protein